MDKNWDTEYKSGAHWEVETSEHAKDFANNYINPNSRILDLGCGSGRDSFYFSSCGHTVSGIDVSKTAIEKAKKKSPDSTIGIDFLVGNAEDLPYQNVFFDGVYSGYVLQRTNLKKVASELNRTTKQNAIVYIVMFEKIDYKDHNKYDLEIDHKEILSEFKKYFSILKQKTDEYSETDQHGEHMHRRLVLVLEKN
ncbi:methyltransferase domain-containing protein [Candidatus Dojkabacteria bacterium]|nr:methyltransferase domain-containing protein [Candidatus Dojkabacteria bacterium]